ncbi:GntR family transcriptional regulator [Streptomyces sp. DSM 41014]|uniref:GntR family transcriptional regulator n=1 Tax=Streptomyces hintoniae TaxID=3075521 RepID=A0ABU2UVC6_9ACTN|nr:GntR family transcriptional regulator [Streptomyces sp. DSM 41014]MDT0477246.1 GntR family transcriptional regulator [Streptomyces sp. DSM 41014]
MTPPKGIDRQSSTPYYQQLVDLLERRLASAEIPPGRRLPSENDLCKEYGLSRATVRQALQVLESRGRATRIAGRGVFAVRPATAADDGWTVRRPEDFLENALGHRNRSVRTRVLAHGPAVLPEFACGALRLPEGTTGYALVRLRTLDGVPALYGVHYSPPALAPVVAASTEVLAGRASLGLALAGAGYPLGGAHRSARAVTPPAEAAEALGIAPATPTLHIRRTSWTPAGERFDVHDAWVRGDVVEMEATVELTGAAVAGAARARAG